MRAGELGVARQIVLDEPAQPGNEALREATLAVLTLADGYPKQAEIPMQRVYETLRTRGLNANKEAASVVFNESVKTWKGEPYEQALLYLYVGMQQAAVGAWGNARAAANSALDLLDEFDRARGLERDNEPTGHGYVVSRSDLALAHLLAAAANQQLGRDDEASDHLERVRMQRPQLSDLCDRVESKQYDTLLVVEMGIGPVRAPSGEDGTEAELWYRWPSDRRALAVFDHRGEVGRFARVLDVNAFADAYRWDHLAPVRRAKSGLGTLMTGVGAGLVLSDDDDARWAGLGLLLGGLAAKATAHADARSLSVLPQRYYLVPILMSEIEGVVELGIGDGPGESMLVPGLELGRRDGVRLIVVRVPANALATASDAWAGARYANDWEPFVIDGGDLPYILGGRCVMTPGPEALAKYQASGHLKGWTSADLRELYRAEGVVVEGQRGEGIPPGLHVLEGGRSLISPEPGTAGYARLFYTEHLPYRPRSRLAREVQGEMSKQQEHAR